MPYGAFVEFLPSKDGLLHVTEIDWKRIEKVEDVLKEGDQIRVKLIGIDSKTGKFKLSHKVLTPKPEGYVEPEHKPFERRGDNNRRGNNENRNNDHNHSNNTEHTRPMNINRNSDRF